MSEYKYIVMHYPGAIIEGVERTHRVSSIDTTTGRPTLHDKCYHAQYDEFVVDEEKLKTSAEYARYFATLEIALVVLRKDAEYSHAQLVVLPQVKGRYMQLHQSTEAKMEVYEYYEQLVGEVRLNEYLDATKVYINNNRTNNRVDAPKLKGNNTKKE